MECKVRKLFMILKKKDRQYCGNCKGNVGQSQSSWNLDQHTVLPPGKMTHSEEIWLSVDLVVTPESKHWCSVSWYYGWKCSDWQPFSFHVDPNPENLIVTDFHCCLSFFTDVSLHLKAYHIITEWEVTCEAWYIFGVMTPTDARLFCNHTDMSLNNILDCQWFYTQYAKTLSFTSQCVHLVFCILLFFLLFYSILLTWNKPEMFPKDFQFTSTPSTNTLNTSTGPTLTVHSHL